MKKLSLLMGLFIVLLCRALPSQLLPADYYPIAKDLSMSEMALDGLSTCYPYQVDSCMFGGLGEDNGGLDLGETASLLYTLKNGFSFNITEIIATLTSNDPGVIVLQDTVNFPDIPEGGVAAATGAFWVQVNENQYSGTMFTMHIDSLQGNWDIPVYAGGCAPLAFPFRREFEVWPLTGWTIIGNPSYGGWKSNAEWGHENAAGEESYGQCAEGVALPNVFGSLQELKSPLIDFGMGMDHWRMHYLCNFQGAYGGGIAFLDFSSDGGATWSTIRLETADDAPEGHSVDLAVPPLQGSSYQGMFRFRLYSGFNGANWQMDRLLFWWSGGGPAGPPIPICMPCSCSNPSEVQLIAPPNGSIGIGTDLLLRWVRAGRAQSYEVYAGPAAGPLDLQGTTTDPFFRMAGLASGTQYSWMISAVNDCGSTESQVWSFATAGGGGGPQRPVISP